MGPIERLIAALHPQPDAPAMIRRLPATVKPSVAAAPGAPPAGSGVATARAAADPTLVTASNPRPAAEARRPAAVTPLAPGRLKLQLTISEATHDKLRRVQDLLRHSVPAGDLDTILDRALTLLLEDLERRRFAAVALPRPATASALGSRHVPAAVRRAVWKRDDGQCAFMGSHGRCRELGFLEFHHLQPHAAGGAATADNISLRCRAHNGYEASLFFGVDGADTVREAWAQY